MTYPMKIINHVCPQCSQTIRVEAYMGNEGWIRYSFICPCISYNLPFNRWDLMLLFKYRATSFV